VGGCYFTPPHAAPDLNIETPKLGTLVLFLFFGGLLCFAFHPPAVRTLTMPEPLSHTRAETSPSSAILRVCLFKGEGLKGEEERS
jgi:hypothetical protein